MLQLFNNLVHRQNSSILATLHCCSKAKQTCALTVFLPPNIHHQQCFASFSKNWLCAASSGFKRSIIMSFISPSPASRQRRRTTDHLLRLHHAIQVHDEQTAMWRFQVECFTSSAHFFPMADFKRFQNHQVIFRYSGFHLVVTSRLVISLVSCDCLVIPSCDFQTF